MVTKAMIVMKVLYIITLNYLTKRFIMKLIFRNKYEETLEDSCDEDQ